MANRNHGFLDALRKLVRPIRRAVARTTRSPRVGRVDWGSLRAISPISRDFGFDRGTPIDRYYIEKFLESSRQDIHGKVLEIGTDMYTVRFGDTQVTHSDVLDCFVENDRATIIADLADCSDLPAAQYDCIICTQTLQFVFDKAAALCNLARLLKAGGVLLMTTAGISQISRGDDRATGDFWRFTHRSVGRLLAQHFPDSAVELITFGNVLACVAFHHGIASEELTTDELDRSDPDFQIIVAARAIRPG